MEDDVATWAWAAVGALVVALTVYAFWSLRRTNLAYEERRRSAGLDATALITDIEDCSENHSQRECFLVLDLTLADGSKRVARKYVNVVPPWEPRVGDELRVRIHPDAPKDFEIVD